MGRRQRLGAFGGAVGLLGVVFALLQLPLTSAQFSASTANGANGWSSAADFCPAGSATLAVLADTWVSERDPNTNYGDDIHVEVEARSGQDKRILLRPDLPTIPARCDLVSAVMVMDEHGYSVTTLEVRPVATSWSEGGVTWNNQPAPTGTAATAAASRVTWSIDVVGPIRDLYASGTNHGIVIRDLNEGTGTQTANRYHTIEHRQTPPAPPATITYSWT